MLRDGSKANLIRTTWRLMGFIAITHNWAYNPIHIMGITYRRPVSETISGFIGPLSSPMKLQVDGYQVRSASQYSQSSM